MSLAGLVFAAALGASAPDAGAAKGAKAVARAADAGAQPGASAAPAPADAGAAAPLLALAWTQSPHRGPVLALAFSKDGTRVATGAGDKVARVFEAAGGKVLFELKGASSPVSAVALSDDGKLVATGEGALAVRLYDGATGKLAREFPHPDAVSGLAFSPDGALLAVAGAAGTGQVYKTADASKVFEFSGRSAAFSQDGKSLVTAVAAGAVRVWDVAAGKLAQELEVAPHMPWLTASADLRVVATWNPAEKDVRLWAASSAPAKGGKKPGGLAAAGVLKGHEKGVSFASLSADGRLLASASEDHTLRLWDVAANKLLGHRLIEQLAFVAFAADGGSLAVAQGINLQLFKVAR